MISLCAPAAALILVALALALGTIGVTADDAISRLLRAQGDAQNLPVAPPQAGAGAVAGPTIGSQPQGPLPIVMSARIGEHEDRTQAGDRTVPIR